MLGELLLASTDRAAGDSVAGLERGQPMSTGTHRLTRLAMDLRAMHDGLLTKAQFHWASEAKRIATELDQYRIDLETASAAEETGVIEMSDVEDVDETKRTR